MMSRCIWALVDKEVPKHVHNAEERGAREWLATMILTLNHDDQIQVFVTLWFIWHARRKAIHWQIFQNPLSVHAFVGRFIEDLSQIDNTEIKSPGAASSSASPAWIPTPLGTVKVNVDAVVSKNSG
jgi:hypothetical protein